MAAPLKAGLPPDLDIGDGYVIRFAAIDAATGNAVTGVTVSGVSVFARQLAGPEGDNTPIPELVPSTALV